MLVAQADMQEQAGAPWDVANTENPQAIARGIRTKTSSPSGVRLNGRSAGLSIILYDPGAGPYASRSRVSAMHVNCMSSSTGRAISIPIPWARKIA